MGIAPPARWLQDSLGNLAVLQSCGWWESWRHLAGGAMPITRKIARLQKCPGCPGAILRDASCGWCHAHHPQDCKTGAILRARKIARLQDCQGSLGAILRVVGVLEQSCAWLVPQGMAPPARCIQDSLGNIAILQSCGWLVLQGTRFYYIILDFVIFYYNLL